VKSSSRRSDHGSTQSEQAAVFFDLLFGKRKGIVAVAIGVGGHFNDRGTYKFSPGGWRQYFFEWPKQRNQLIKWAIANSRDADVYVNPTLRASEDRRKGSCTGSQYCWADVDHMTERTKLRIDGLLTEGSFVVESGRGRHVYIRLASFQPPHVIEDLNRLLAEYLSGDRKWDEAAMLRIPGTQNQKGRARGGKPYPVLLDASDGSAPPWSPAELKAVLNRGV